MEQQSKKIISGRVVIYLALAILWLIQLITTKGLTISTFVNWIFGTAVILIIIEFIYQKFFNKKINKNNKE